MNSLLVIVVTYNAMPWAERCFNSLKNSSVANDIFVIDNGSTDGTQAYVRQNIPSAIFVQSEKNLGFGSANNEGLKYALAHGYDYVYLLNQDAWVMPDTFEKLIQIHKNHPEFGVLSPMQMDGSGRRFDKNFRDFISKYKQTFNSPLIDDLYFNDLKDVYEVDFVMAAHWLISSQCLRITGGFSPAFHHYGEDDNYIHRICFHKFKVGIVPTARAIHDRVNRKLSKQKQIFFISYNSWLITLSNPNNENGLLILIALLKDGLSKAFFMRSFAPIKYCGEFLVNYRKIRSIRKRSIQEKCAFLQT